MAFNPQAASGILSLVINAVSVAETFLRGGGRGKEKRDAAVNDVIERLQENANEADRQLEVPGVTQKIDWLGLIMKAPDLYERVGVAVDAVVGILNFVKQFQNVPAVVKTDEGGPVVH